MAEALLGHGELSGEQVKAIILDADIAAEVAAKREGWRKTVAQFETFDEVVARVNAACEGKPFRPRLRWRQRWARWRSRVVRSYQDRIAIYWASLSQ